MKIYYLASFRCKISILYALFTVLASTYSSLPQYVEVKGCMNNLFIPLKIANFMCFKFLAELTGAAVVELPPIKHVGHVRFQ